MYLGFIGFGAVVAATIGATACLCAKRRAWVAYLAWVALLTAVGIVVAVTTAPSYYPTRQSIFVATDVPAIGCGVPDRTGVACAKGAPPKKILIITLLVTALAVPF